MDLRDVADQLGELAEGLRQVKAEEAREEREEARERSFQRQAALVIAILAMLLAINSLGGSGSTSEQTLRTIEASNTWAFFQAKNIRQTDYQLAADELELLLPSLPPEARSQAEDKIDRYRATAARYESEPDLNDPTDPLKGEGKKELTAIARDQEERRDRASRQGPNFDLAGSAFQIAIVLGSVAILSTSRRLMGVCIFLGGVATLLMLNGYFLLVDLPVG